MTTEGRLDSLRVPADRLTCACDPSQLGFRTTREVEVLEGTIGQDRAVRALEFGLSIEAQGFNVFVTGLPGTGRNTTLASYLRKAAAKKPVPSDWCYVHSFKDPTRPKAISLPSGRGAELGRDVDRIVQACKTAIPKVFESDAYRERVEEAMRDVQSRKEALMHEIEVEAEKRGFRVQSTQLGIVTVPLVDGQPIAREEFSNLPEEARDRIKEQGEQLQSPINQRLAEARRLDKEAEQRKLDLDREVVRLATEPLFQEARWKYGDLPAVLFYLGEVQTDVIESFQGFLPQEDEQKRVPAEMFQQGVESEWFARYKVNVIVNNGELTSAPVVFEYSPTYYNLFGRLEYRARFGAATTDVTMIRPGAIHRANGGYLVVQAKDLFSSFLSWDTMKRALRSREARIENLGDQFSAIPTASLNPEPVPINTKIILVGNPYLYRMLQLADEDFRKFFKVKADFDISMERTQENIGKYASFIENRCREMALRPFDAAAVAKVVEYSSRLVEHQNRLTTRFMDVADLVTEANYWAEIDNSANVRAKHIQQAIQERIYRSNLPEEHIQKYISDGTIRIDTQGKVVGQVNGIAILDLGDYSFGKPSRITARVSLGRGQVVNIEQETQMSGRIHNKGFMTLVGYLMGKYGQDKPLNLRATIGFEQTYDEVDGDSASSTELYALLSAISGIPIDQGTAVTGSVNQQGQVQAVGGVTRKVEGFFDVCKIKGLTGSQGVVVPSDNVKNLVLREDLIDAVREGKFHIYAVSTVEEGMEVLTGVPAGEPQPDGMYPEGTLNHRIDQTLKRMAEKAREAGRQDGGEPGKGHKDQDQNSGAAQKEG